MLNLRLLLFAAGLVNSLAAQQHAVVVDKEPLPSKPPQTAPEPRRKLETNPDEMMPLLISNDAAQRRLALERLDVSWFPEGLPTDVRHFALNLDSSEDFERVLMISSSGQSVAIVFKRENGVWWDIGSFGCCWPGTGRDFHVEFKQTVWS
ncbi:MAG: hypothetical protein ABI972_31240, partial [Acidobacteriota bacterium]